MQPGRQRQERERRERASAPWPVADDCVSHSVPRHSSAIGSAILRVKIAHSQSVLASAKAATVCLRAARKLAQNAKPVSVSSSVSVMKYA